MSHDRQNHAADADAGTPNDLLRMVMEAAAISHAEPPDEIFIAPWGEVRTSAGSFVVDEESASTTIAAFEAHGTDLPVDYEHQTLGGAYSSPTGQAPAAGWIKSLTAVTPQEAARTGRRAGLWARVQWTKDAAEQLAARAYRYLSPVALVRRGDRRLVGLHSVALTNKPAIVGMQPLVTSDARIATSPPSPGVESPEDVTDPATRLRGVLHMDRSTPDDVILFAAADRILMLESLETMRRAEERVAAAMGEGKLTEAQREWALALAHRDPEEFDRWRRSAPPLVPLGRLVHTSSGDGAATRTQRSREAEARVEWAAHRAFLEKLCTQEAYLACARRSAESSTEADRAN